MRDRGSSSARYSRPTPAKSSNCPGKGVKNRYKPNQSSAYSLYVKALYQFLIHTNNINFGYSWVFQSGKAQQIRGLPTLGYPPFNSETRSVVQKLVRDSPIPRRPADRSQSTTKQPTATLFTPRRKTDAEL